MMYDRCSSEENAGAEMTKQQAVVSTYWRFSVPALLMISASCCVEAQQLPVGGNVLRGDIALVSEQAQERAQTLHIVQREARGEIEWASFNIGEGHRVRVEQPSVDAVLLNRVTGRAPSVLAGTIEANGIMLLVNPNGIEITPTGFVRAAGFAASSLDLRHDDVEGLFKQSNIADLEDDVTNLINRTRSRRAAHGARCSPIQGAGVTHRGTILLDDNGTAMLFGAAVESRGPVIAPGGRIALIAATPAIPPLSLDDRPAEDLGAGSFNFATSRVGDPNERADHEVAAVRLGGILQARSTALRRGQIVVSAEAQGASIRGLLDTSGASARVKQGETPGGETKGGPLRGGLVIIVAGQIDIADALLNASGNERGGEIFITTRDAKGADARIDVSRAARLFANAEGARLGASPAEGIGGKVTLSTTGALSFNGHVQAKAEAPSVPAHSGGPSPDASKQECVGGSILFASHGQMKLRGEIDASPAGMLPNGTAVVNVTGLRIAPWDGERSEKQDETQDKMRSDHLERSGNVLDNDTLSATLRGTAVALMSQDGEGGKGDATIYVDAPVKWSSNSGLVMHSDSSIQFHAPMRAKGMAASVHLSTTTKRAYVFDGGSLSLSGRFSMMSVDSKPYNMIRNAAQLRAQLTANDGGLHALACSIDLASAAFVPIDSPLGRHFLHFEGLGNTISNLRVEAPMLPRVGLFATLGNNALVSNLVLANAELHGGDHVGAVVGVMQGASQLDRVHIVNASVRNHQMMSPGDEVGGPAARGSVGGAVGAMGGSSAIRAVTGSVHVAGVGNVGGIAGTMIGSSSISTSTMRGAVAVAGRSPAGGMVGAMNDHATISHVQWHGAVRGLSDQTENVGPSGGAVGLQMGGTVEHVLVEGSVAGVKDVGGVVGAAMRTSQVHHCTARNIVSGTRSVGGLAGSATGSAALSSNTVLSAVEGERDVGSLVGFFEGGGMADNRTHGIVTQFGRNIAAPIGRRGLAKNARYLRGPYVSAEEMPLRVAAGSDSAPAAGGRALSGSGSIVPIYEDGDVYAK